MDITARVGGAGTGRLHEAYWVGNWELGIGMSIVKYICLYSLSLQLLNSAIGHDCFRTTLQLTVSVTKATISIVTVATCLCLQLSTGPPKNQAIWLK
jgi:hypothetical protein